MTTLSSVSQIGAVEYETPAGFHRAASQNRIVPDPDRFDVEGLKQFVHARDPSTGLAQRNAERTTLVMDADRDDRAGQRASGMSGMASRQLAGQRLRRIRHGHCSEAISGDGGQCAMPELRSQGGQKARRPLDRAPIKADFAPRNRRYRTEPHEPQLPGDRDDHQHWRQAARHDLCHDDRKRPEQVQSEDFFAGKKVALFSVPGAFTPTCSAKHLPGFIERPTR